MASEERKQLAIELKPLMKTAGFTKTGFNWHRTFGSVIHVVNIQGSQWSNSVYINLGIYFIEIGSNEKPAECDCHIRNRLSSFSPDLERCNELLDLENEIENEQRLKEISFLIQKYAFSWFELCSTKKGARQYIEQHNRHGVAVSIRAKRYLSATSR